MPVSGNSSDEESSVVDGSSEKKHVYSNDGGKSLYEAIQENRARAEEKYQEEINAQNLGNRLNGDEQEYIRQLVQKKQQKDEKLKREVREKTEEFKARQARLESEKRKSSASKVNGLKIEKPVIKLAPKRKVLQNVVVKAVQENSGNPVPVSTSKSEKDTTKTTEPSTGSLVTGYGSDSD